jgi:hypothetical protein
MTLRILCRILRRRGQPVFRYAQLGREITQWPNRRGDPRFVEYCERCGATLARARESL